MSVPEPAPGFNSIGIHQSFNEAYQALKDIPLSQKHQFKSLAVEQYGGGWAVVGVPLDGQQGFAVSVDEMLRRDFAQYSQMFNGVPGRDRSFIQKQWVDSRKAEGKAVPEGW